MNELLRLREKRGTKVTEARAILDRAKADNNRSLNADESTAYEAIMTEVRSLATDIKRLEELEEVEREGASQQEARNRNTHSTQEARDLASYSLVKAVRSTLPADKGGIALDGIEKEMHEEAVKEARANNATVVGVGIPQLLIGGTERRDNSITMPTQPQDGSAVMEQQTRRPIIDLLRPNSVLRRLGATFLTGLTGNVGVPSMASGATSTWKAEVEELDKSNQTFADAEMTPHRLGTWARRSKQFLLQTAPSVNTMLARDLEWSIVQALEIAAIIGTGTNNQPLGILNNPDILQLATGANGDVPTRDTLILLEALVEEANTRNDSLGYLLNVQTKSKLKRTKVDAGSGLFLMNSNTELNDYPVAVTTNVPKNVTKGTSGATLSSAVFGNWSDLLVGQWGGLDITTDPYTRAKFGQIDIIIQSFHDVLVQQPKAFAAVKGLITT